jgi:hypothetical protein
MIFSIKDQMVFQYFLKGGVDIVSMIQLFNWVTKSYYGTILTLWKLIGPLAFFLQFAFMGYIKCFPDMPYFLSTDPPENWCEKSTQKIYFDTGFKQQSTVVNLIMSILMFLLIILELFTFSYFPLEKVIIMERE